MVQQSLFSQSRDSRRKKSPGEEFKERLWYGGGLNLGFSSSGISGFGGNSFYFGISPLVGYKIFDILSVGPRVELQYLTGRIDQGFGNPIRYNTFTYGGGVFSRVKLFNILFTHIEYDYLSRQNVSLSGGSDVIKQRFGQSLFLVGGGYNSGGKIGSEIYILYDVLDDGTSIQVPVQYRFGITVNF